MSPERIAQVRRLGADWVQEGLTPALQVIVARHGTIVLHQAWGRQGPSEDDPPLSLDSIFPLASMTKPITATAVLCLVEDGLLGLNRPVQEYIPGFVGEGKAAVMVHHLLTHTSGLRDGDLSAYAAEAVRTGRIAERSVDPRIPPFLRANCFFGEVDDAPLTTSPGVEMSYCNYGYRLLAEIVTQVSGQPIEAFVQERILDPLGMASTSYRGLPVERRDRLVRRAADAPFAIADDPALVAFTGVGAGSAYANARDVATFLQMFLNGGVYGGQRILSPASVREMTRDQIPGIGSTWGGEFFPDAGWGYGWGIEGNKKGLRDSSLHSAATFAHGGASMSVAWVDPDCDLLGVYQSVLPPPRPQMAPGRRGQWHADLFINAVMASVVE